MKILPKGLRSFIFSLLLLLLLFPASIYADTTCIDWSMVMTKQERETRASGPWIIIHDFQNQTKRPQDEWLTFGIRTLLGDLLKSGENINIRSGSIAKTAPSPSPDYAIDGKFQFQEKTLRIYLFVKDKKEKLVLQEAMTFPYPKHRDFFVHISETAKKLFTFFDTPYNTLAFSQIRDATSSTECYENYTRGREKLETYKEEHIEQALLWFHEAKRSDYQSPLGYEGVIDVHLFLGLIKKQNNAPYAEHYHLAEEEIARMTKLAKRIPSPRILPKKPKPVAKEKLIVPFQNRFLQGHAAFLEGVEAKKSGNLSKAETSFEQATIFVPEDARAWYELANVAQERGKRSFSKSAMKTATTLNRCLEPEGSEK